MKSAYVHIIKDLESLRNPERAISSARFFKTGKGEYGHGDVFWGITVPQQRVIVRRHATETSISDIQKLLYSPVHEHRLVALLILVAQFQKANAQTKQSIFDFYVRHIGQVNNWDLVDSSADKIVGAYLFLTKKSTQFLEKLAQSKHLWTRRVAIIATFYFIKQGEFEPTLRISEMLLGDAHDLIHKAVGWMLREVGKKSLPAEEVFLNQHYKTMPRTMLRYAIERFSKEKKAKYMRKSATGV